MPLNFTLFLILAVIAIASALGMLFSKNAVYSALFLILNFAVAAFFYLILDAPFIALTQITVYAGAIMVLFLFVIMLLGAEQTGRMTAARWVRPTAITLAALLVVETIYIMFTQKGTIASLSSIPPDFGAPEVVGQFLFNQYLLPFEVTSILLLAAMIGAIVLTKRKS
ncbi:MAG: NADH-quinone oxidoreductase subunit J [Anaerolineales bacterium]|nr:NADH-quinone oxidoreductase subunit J [Anaerolineales bacterium]